MKSYRLCFLALTIILGCSAPDTPTPVGQNGQLSIDGRFVTNEAGEPVQIRGMSFFWHQWENSHAYWNAECIQWLADDWKVDAVRLPVGIHETGWFADSLTVERAVRRGIEGAAAAGLYVVVDWHSHNIHTASAVGFFSRIAKEYGHLPNVVYEIFNEPDGASLDSLDETWSEIKAYSEEVIAAIRAHDPDNIIVVGTPFWSQLVDTAADDPLLSADGKPLDNIAYTLHFYAAHHQDDLMARANYAVERGLPIWVTECGRTGVNYGPNNSLDPAYWDKWEAWMDQNKISWNKWSLSIKNEVSSSLKPGASTTGQWQEEDLTSEGIWNRNHFRSLKE
ncbi:glycoside hydrolase family 5 protein [Marinoscillum furvescens]|nr:glycoside hydrolase family 5 protein [Marinoscillum furvescens]